jgi:hypothetical protein
MAATDVLKPDHAHSRKHFIFTDEHEQLRESIHNFVVKELRPTGSSRAWASSASSA